MIYNFKNNTLFFNRYLVIDKFEKEHFPIDLLAPSVQTIKFDKKIHA